MGLLGDAAYWTSQTVEQLMKRGFPEHTAKKIQSGELPVGNASPYLLAPTAAATAATMGLLAPQDAEAGVITRNGKRMIDAWHASPHRFDKFSMDHIGTGEGAQAYGHGLYFADERDTTRMYRPGDLDNEEWMLNQYKAAEKAENYPLMDAWEQAMIHDKWTLRDLADGGELDDATRSAYLQVADKIEQNPAAGATYRVEIDADPDTMFQWDKPLRDQPENVRVALGFTKTPEDLLVKAEQYARNGDNATSEFLKAQAQSLENELSKTGDEYLQRLFHQTRKKARADGIDSGGAAFIQKQVSEDLRSKGIPGIRYLDGQSRNAGEGSYNYVVFDDNLIDIKERGNANIGLLTALAGGSAAAAADKYLNPESRSKGLLEGDVGSITADEYPTLNRIADGIDTVRGSLPGLLGLLAPGDDFAEYLRNFGRERSIGKKAKDALFAGWDISPL